jgi:hypothetical protein
MAKSDQETFGMTASETAASSFSVFGQTIVQAARGVVDRPVEMTEKSGVIGGIGGVFLGLAGQVTSPFVATINLGSRLITGVTKAMDKDDIVLNDRGSIAPFR